MTTKNGISKIELGDEGISVEWSDGHKSLYNPKHVRINCGCAECVEEWSSRQLLDPASVPADIRAEDYLMVGKYAVQFLWSDAHFTGIYPFETLRRLCACDECGATR
jgi:DUF971 family protein